MRHALRLTLRYLAFDRWRTIILVTCIGLVFFLPMAVSLLVGHFEEELGARADTVPLVVGAKGSRYDLVLGALYFRGAIPDMVSVAEVDEIREMGRGRPVPVLVGPTAGGRPVVGTSLDYFGELGLTVGRGTLPLRLGDAVLGAEVANELGIGPGDRVITDGEKLYDISSNYPVRLRVTGVLRPKGTPDDRAIFVDVKTAWVIVGIGHGHVEAAKATDGSGGILERKEGEVVFNDSIVKYIEIDEKNIASFHFHREPTKLPVSAILVWPDDTKASTILQKHRFQSELVQTLVPRKVIEELMGFVFRIKRFFDANFILVGVATALFLALVVLLSLRIRRRELETLFKIGCSRFTVFRLQALELAVVLGLGVLLAGALSGAAFWYVVSMNVL